jgi:hypothetical protein
MTTRGLWRDALRSIQPGLAEGVGFEPTVGCPTLDFESSALNRTQPPFLIRQKINVQRPTPNAERPMEKASLGSTLGVGR